MVNVVTSFFYNIYWFVLKFVQYTVILILFIYLVFKIPSLIDYLRDEFIPIYREDYLKADYKTNKDIMFFEDNRIHPYVFYYIHEQLEPRFIYTYEEDLHGSFNEIINLKSFYSKNKNIISKQSLNEYRVDDLWGEYLTYNPIVKLDDTRYLVYVFYNISCGSSCMNTANYYIFEYDGQNLKVKDFYLPGTVWPGKIKYYKIIEDTLYIKVEGYAVKDKEIKFDLKK
tara:strand:+ start:127 stop:807 length:681 start_codon:yes stop_codon:yes gene_type:complete